MHSASELKSGIGVDESAGIIEKARIRRMLEISNLKFEVIDGPVLPFADGSFDVVISLMSFRYLDWDPLSKGDKTCDQARRQISNY